MRYVVDSPHGQRLQGVKELSEAEAEYFTAEGYKLRAYKDDRLSRAASAIWRFRTAEPDPMGDPSGDCGALIAQHERSVVLRAIERAGFKNPGEYNSDLRSRLAPEYPKMSHAIHVMLMTLEAEDVCDRCGSALNVTSHRTRNYGGGWDTMVRCPVCGYAEVYV